MGETGGVKIGLEVHIELLTETKMFCRCRRGEECCPVCRGEPGAKPMPNRKALVFAAMACKALDARLASHVKFDRKSYFYPDLPKNFQITQYDEPMGREGRLDAGGKRIRIERVSIEEDPAKIRYPLSPRASQYCFIDYSRSGSPLLEIVTAPELESPEQAREFLQNLSNLVSYLGIFDPEKCLIKCDANISIAETGFRKVEIKNISGFRDVEKALRYEIIRQRKTGASEETRGWDGRVTYPMREKEGEEDYGYIPEPNIHPIPVSSLGNIEIPELPWQRAERFVSQYSVAEDDAAVICSSFRLSEVFEGLARRFAGRGRDIGHWLRKELLKVLNYTGRDVSEVDAEKVGKILEMFFSGKISDTAAKELMKGLFDMDDAEEYARRQGWMEGGIDEGLLERVIRENRKAVEDYLSGNRKAIFFLVGKVMRERPGFDAREVRKRLEKMLSGAGIGGSQEPEKL